MATFTPNKGYSLPTVGGDTGVWGGELNAGWSLLDNNMGGLASVNCAGSSNVTATNAQYQCLVQDLTGILTGSIEYILPALGGFYIIENNTTGAYTVEVITSAAGASVLAGQGQATFVYCDGTNIYAIAPTQFFGVASVSVAGGSNVTATPVNYALTVQELTGTISANIEYILPAIDGRWIISNGTTGNYTVTIASVGAGTTVLVPQGAITEVWSDGTNIFKTNSGNPTQVTVDVAGGSNVDATLNDSAALIQTLTGTITADINYVLPAGAGHWIVENQTSGAHTLAVTQSGSTGTVLVAQGYNAEVYGDGSNLAVVNNNTPFQFNPSTGAVSIDGLGAGTTFSGPVAINTTGVALFVEAGAASVLSGNVELGCNNNNPIGNNVPGVLVNTNGNIQVYCDNSETVLALAGGSSGNLIIFYNAATPPVSVGSVVTNGSTTAYNTTSDARLKDKRAPLAGFYKWTVGELIDRLRPLWFTWKANPNGPLEPGFFAQEVHKIWPWAVTKGKGKPGKDGFMPWQMDNAKLVPLLVVEIQDLRRRVAELEKG